MPLYRKKPVVIEAFQYWYVTDDKTRAFPKWFVDALLAKTIQTDDYDDNIYISTLEGRMKVGNGDFIIQGVKGEIYPCKPDIFHETYEEAV